MNTTLLVLNAATEHFGSLFHNHPLHFLTEVVLVLFVFYLWSQKRFKQQLPEDTLTTEEEDQLIEEWEPAPLIPVNAAPQIETQQYHVSGPVDKHFVVNGKKCLNLASNGVLGFQNNPKVKQAAIDTCKKFGAGSCGPRGFYGSLQPHLDFEVDIAEFMGTEAGVLYPSELQTIATVIPAFSKASDYVIADKGCYFGVQNGLRLSRSKVHWFQHNDMKDLKQALESHKDVFKKKVHKVFVVVEGIYTNFGDMCPLDEIMALKERYPFRLIIDESFSFGVLGKSGKGITEHFGVPTADVEIIVASIGNALGSVGAFTLAQTELCNHQIINCTGYVFSCASPAFTSAAASTALKLLKSGEVNPGTQLHPKVREFHQKLNHMLDTVFQGKQNSKRPYLENISSVNSPYITLPVKNGVSAEDSEEKILKIISMCWDDSVAVTTASYSVHEKYRPSPSLKLSVFASLSEEEMDMAIGVLQKAIGVVFE